MKKMRLDKFLSEMGVDTRKNLKRDDPLRTDYCQRAAGAAKPELRVDAETDLVAADGWFRWCTKSFNILC